MDSVASQLKQARKTRNLSQNDVATILHISRQSISKWENGRAYPDMDNLILLSDLYQKSIDELVQNNEELRKQIKNNDQKIKEDRAELGKINTELYQNRNEGFILLILVLASAIVPPVGIILPMYVMWRNNRYNALHKTIYLVSIIVILISAWGTYIFLSDNWLEPTHTEVYRID
ncbi:DNA-binding helix-turn-helix protein [Lentilactobacillus senioris DSM 24302 = JCM 17472]|uniref:DNA-binding helix-turn-helix protein n=1 Tax=Lentilactobacillus senioris DSM 24302 = JCM 17472 TaxID=1423802 RepID=A0A0R2CX92_9LACO|nr:helix-turn-helix domain-containing protein [Lentilactobacillus senioris]KRM94420.1 DNA-binding helix-turn-helix protein [Lentilactobacillus senioris DSM 24302 = JCM 17472]